MTSGGDDAVTREDYAVDNDSLNAFVKTNAGQKYNSLMQGGLTGFHKYSDGTYTAYDKNDYNQDTTGLINDYTAWMATQKDYNQQRQSYLDLASQERGRDATILTGPAASPVGTTLTQTPLKLRY